MKKLIAALLVLTMVLALTGTAFAACKFQIGDHVKFTKNTVAYSAPRDSKDTDTIVRKGSIARVVDTKGSKWVKLQLNYTDASKTGWFKADDLKATNKVVTVSFLDIPVETVDIYVTYSNGGVGLSTWMFRNIPDIVTPACRKVEATAKVWMHYQPCLKNNYGRALHKGDRVKYRYLIGMDDRFVGFYGIRYNGKNLWVSSEYSKLVKK